MRITILYDNTVFRKGRGLRSDWGFSALVEVRSRRILFDTGANSSILLANMERLSVDPADVTDVFISHAHFDHTGGLSAFLVKNPRVKIWVPPSFRGVKSTGEAMIVQGPRTLYEGIYSTGELEGIEQSLCLETGRGIVIVVGCAHPPMAGILSAASRFGPLYGVIGGLHGNKPETLGSLHLICATHCTQYKRQIQALYYHRSIEGGVGRVIEVADSAVGPSPAGPG